MLEANSKSPQEDTDIPPELQLRLEKKDTNNPFVSACNLPAIEYKIQQLLNINPKIWHELKDKGVLPINATYGECLQAVFNHYRSKSDAATIKAKVHAARSGNIISPDTDSGLSRLLEAEKIQKIRLDKAKEQEIYLRNSITRNTVLDKNELYSLIAPLLGNIANVLRSAADETPELQETIDKCFSILFNAGEKIVEQANEDKLNYVQHMLDNPLDLEEILDSEVTV